MPPPRPSRRCTSAPLPRAGLRPVSWSRGAFTLIELLTVVAVIAILATFAVGAVRGAKERANIARARSELAALVTALEEFKRRYGDYPQTGEFTQAAATPTLETTGPGVQTAQAKLFNALTGVFGARAFTNSDRLNGPNFLDVGKFSLNGSLTNQFLIPVSNAPNPPSKLEQNVCLLDPWGRRYLYYYKNARNPNQWQATGYVLYSAGRTVAANGTQTPPITVTTGLMLATQSAEMADNIYANP
ncbi:MAG: prepilin-type N-terminal cleavage/methylation domain-containing protein [Opitutaceae bacterium]|nr:prepilin-type N-terminal cleavage/methylation domain-containing protein [Opitutaceae bacterium]